MPALDPPGQSAPSQPAYQLSIAIEVGGVGPDGTARPWKATLTGWTPGGQPLPCQIFERPLDLMRYLAGLSRSRGLR